jgi:hypothetical protein
MGWLHGNMPHYCPWVSACVVNWHIAVYNQFNVTQLFARHIRHKHMVYVWPSSNYVTCWCGVAVLCVSHYNPQVLAGLCHTAAFALALAGITTTLILALATKAHIAPILPKNCVVPLGATKVTLPLVALYAV